MGIFETVVVGADGSAAAAEALKWARSVVPDEQSIHTVRAEADDGDPAEFLLRAAASVNADAIVIGRHVSHWPLGSIGGVTRRLLQKATIPVIIARPDDRARRRIHGRSRLPIVACVGYGPPAETAAIWAAALADEVGEDLTLLHVVGHRPIYPADSPSDTLGSYLGPDVLMQWVGQDLDHLRSEVIAAHPDVSVDTTVEVGPVARSLVAAGRAASTLVVGRRTGCGVFRGFLSPRIQQVIARASSTIAVIPTWTAET